MKMTSLAPDMYLCKKIPGDYFRQSALVWVSEKMGVCPREMVDSDLYDIPAPTLEEILMELPNGTKLIKEPETGDWFVIADTQRMDIHSAVDAAMKLWLEMKGIE